MQRSAVLCLACAFQAEFCVSGLRRVQPKCQAWSEAAGEGGAKAVRTAPPGPQAG